jgi:hypothetical protein
MGKISSTTRRRRKTNSDPSAKTPSDGTNTKFPRNHKPKDEIPHSNWRVLKNHPVAWVLVLIAIPCGLNIGWRKMILQTSMSSRPQVDRRDERQVLIMGSMMSFSGNSKNSRNHNENNMATNLQRELGLEIGYEDSDSSWNFVRDGTASWIHGLRYFERRRENGDGNNYEIEKESSHLAFEERIRHLCRLKWALTYDSRDRYGFEQTVFGSDSDFNNCSVFNPDSRRCQLPICEESMKKEYGCALHFHVEEDETSCDMMPFQTTLLQTRQPWHIVRSLVERYCWKKDSVRENMPSSLEDLFMALELIPPVGSSDDNNIDALVVDNNATDFVPKADHCVNQFIDYVAGYYNTVLGKSNDMAPSSGISITKTYKIEETSPCEVAELAGLFDPETTVYVPNHAKVKRKCAAVAESSKSFNDTIDAAARGTGANLSFEDDLEVISVERDLVSQTTPEHLKRIKQLFERLDYEYSEE